MYRYICVRFVLKNELSKRSYVYELNDSVKLQFGTDIRLGQRYIVISETGYDYGGSQVEVCGYWETYNKCMVYHDALESIDFLERNDKMKEAISIVSIVRMELKFDPFPVVVPEDVQVLAMYSHNLSFPVSNGLKNFKSLGEFLANVSNVEDKNKNKGKKAERIEAIKNNDKKEDKNMNLFKNYGFGKYTGRNLKLSFKGLAYRTMDNEYVVYDAESQSLTNVTDFIMEDFDFLYVVPVAIKEVKIGDVVIFNNVPVIVTEVYENSNKFSVVNPGTKEIVTILPEKNLFGFNFMSKIISLFDIGTFGTCDESNPFGNMIPFMLMANKENSTMEKLLIMQMVNGEKVEGFNPVMLMALCDKESGDSKSDMLMMMAMMNGFKM